jgi:hypothetical protein
MSRLSQAVMVEGAALLTQSLASAAFVEFPSPRSVATSLWMRRVALALIDVIRGGGG